MEHYNAVVGGRDGRKRLGCEVWVAKTIKVEGYDDPIHVPAKALVMDSYSPRHLFVTLITPLASQG